MGSRNCAGWPSKQHGIESLREHSQPSDEVRCRLLPTKRALNELGAAMSHDQKTSVSGVIGISLGIVLVLILIIEIFEHGGWDYINRVNRGMISHEKLTSVHSHGSWSAGEYKECYSFNTKEEDADPQLWCGDSSLADQAKVFKVKFSGDLTFDEDKKEGNVHYWRCRHNGDVDATITCEAKQK